MRPLYTLAAPLAALVIALVCPRAAAQTMHAVRMGTATFSSPVWVTAAPGDTAHLFILTKAGTIQVMDAVTGALQPTPFLTVTNITSISETGLLGLAFHPDYAHNGFFYIYHSYSDGTMTGRMIARYHVSANPLIADASTKTTIFFYQHPVGIHNGGWMDFGPDGMLYIAWGNEGNGSYSSNLTLPLGKMLRIDVNGPDGIPGTADDDQFPADPNRNFCIPANNPFAGTANEQTIWAYGLRNPWRDSFDRQTGELYIADVGDGTWEEVDVAPPPPAAPGRNYGYPCMEGAFCDNSTVSTSCACNNPTLTPPIYAYQHTSGNCAIQGGFVYRGCAMPWLRGQYVFADYCTGHIWSAINTGTAFANVTDRTQQVWGAATGPQTMSMGQDAKGELYICTTTAVYRLVPTTITDCNGNGIPDGCDIASGTSQDVNHNNIPDECESPHPCRPCDADFNQDGETGTDADIESFFAAIAGHGPFGADFNGDGDSGTDADIESFFRVLAGGAC